MRTYIFKAHDAPIVLLVIRKNQGGRQFWHLIKWNLINKSFEPGQWLFNKQLFIRGCALSPDGQLFYWVYNRYQDGIKAYAGISNLPLFTAVMYGESNTSRRQVGRFCQTTGRPVNNFDLKAKVGQMPIDVVNTGPTAYSGLLKNNSFEHNGRVYTIISEKVYEDGLEIYDYSGISPNSLKN